VDTASRDFFITSAARFVSTVGYTAVVVAIMLEIQRNFPDPGFGIGVLNAAFGALVIKRTAEHRRGQVSSITQALSRAAALGALGLGGFLGSVFGPRIGFVASGSAALLASLCGAALLLLRFREQESVEQQLADRVE